MSVVSSQGTTVTFNGQSLGKVVGVSGKFASATKEVRSLDANVDNQTGQYLSIYEPTLCDQTVEIESIGGGSGSVSSGMVGSKGSLFVSGDGWLISFGFAICESFTITAKVGDVVRFTCAFKRTFS